MSSRCHVFGDRNFFQDWYYLRWFCEPLFQLVSRAFLFQVVFDPFVFSHAKFTLIFVFLWLLMSWMRFWLIGITSLLLWFFSAQAIYVLAFTWLFDHLDEFLALLSRIISLCLNVVNLIIKGETVKPS